MSGKPFVPVLGADGKPLMPCTGKRARLLLERERAFVRRHMPFTIQMKDRTQDDCELQPIQLKIDPGSVGTGMAVVRSDTDGVVTVVRLIELEHRGKQISRKMTQRAMYRRNRRNRKTRYRQPRFDNRTRPEGWLPPSLMHRVDTTLSWIRKLRDRYPITSVWVESVKFDMQKLRNPNIAAHEYQQGSLYKYEVKEYLLEKWGRACAYCDETKVSRFEIDHGWPRSRGGADSIWNFVLSCHICNHDRKKNQTVQEFLAHDPIRRDRILSMLKAPLNDAAAVNATRNRLLTELKTLRLPVFTGTGAQTKRNRCELGIPKTHALDAVSVGVVYDVRHWQRQTLAVTCTGRGRYQRTVPDKYGFPRLYLSRKKHAYGFATGDLVRVDKPATKLRVAESYQGRVTIRQNGGFRIDVNGIAKTAMYCSCTRLQRADGYQYRTRPLVRNHTHPYQPLIGPPPRPKERGVRLKEER